MWGRLWLVDDDQFEELDRIEANYRRQDVTVHRVVGAGHDTEEVSAITYVVRDDRRAADEDAPAPAYLQHMLDGATECGLPEDHVRRLRLLTDS